MRFEKFLVEYRDELLAEAGMRNRWVSELVRESVERGERSLDRDIEEYARRLDALKARR